MFGNGREQRREKYGFGHKTVTRSVRDAEDQANAALIIAAPDLLAALTRGLRLYEKELLHLVPSKDAEAFLSMARAAIAKATTP